MSGNHLNVKHLLTILTILSFTTSCATRNTDIHLFTQGIDEAEVNRVADGFSMSGYDLYLNAIDIPENIQGPTVVYSPLHPNLSSVDQILDILSALGYKNIDLIEFQKDNHFYTRNNVGIYLRTYIPPSNSGFDIRSVMKEYHGLCKDADVYLNLENINVFKLTRINWVDESNEEETSVTTGLWIISDEELNIFTNEDNTVFEISRFKEEKKGRKIRGVKLIKKNSDSEITNCDFEYREYYYSQN